jgi:hypothetical protein
MLKKLSIDFKKISTIFFSILLFSCSSEKRNNSLKYFSVEKWLQTNNQIFQIADTNNFYSFQSYLEENVKDTSLKNNFLSNRLINENWLMKFLNDKYNSKESKHSVNLFKKVKTLNLNFNRDSSILLLDIHKKFSLLSIGSTFSTKAWGAGFTGRENYLITNKNDSIIIIAELPQGILKGIYIKNNLICKLIFEDFVNCNYEKNYHCGDVMFELDITTKDIKFSKILNVRNGEPMDYNDKKNYFRDIVNFVFEFKP